MSHIKRLLLIRLTKHFGREVVKGIYDYCRDRCLWAFRYEEDRADTLKRMEFAIRRWRPDGIIGRIRQGAMGQMLKESGLPTVNVSAAYPMELPTVVMDNVEVGRLAARHFLDNRFTTFGYTSNTSELSTRQRCQGFVDELKTAGYECSVLSDRFAGMANATGRPTAGRVRSGCFCSRNPWRSCASTTYEDGIHMRLPAAWAASARRRGRRGRGQRRS